MKRSKFSDEQILAIVKGGEAGRKLNDLCRTCGITEQTYYRWKAKHGAMELSEMQRLKQLEDENRRLKQIVAGQTLDIPALMAVVAKKMVSPIARRDAVGWQLTAGTSLRRACRVTGLSTATWRYQRRPNAINAAERARFGYRCSAHEGGSTAVAVSPRGCFTSGLTHIIRVADAGGRSESPEVRIS